MKKDMYTHTHVHTHSYTGLFAVTYATGGLYIYTNKKIYVYAHTRAHTHTQGYLQQHM